MSYLATETTVSQHVREFLINTGLPVGISNVIVDFLGLVIVFASAIVVYSLLRLIIRRFLKRLVVKSVSKWDDYLYENKVFTRLALLVPVIILHLSLPTTIRDYPSAIRFLDVALEVFSVLVILLVVNSFFKAVYQIYNDVSGSNAKPIKGYLQIARIILYLIGGIIITSFLIGQSPLNLLAGLGAISAVLLLIFKDSILGFVAGVQISTNNMLQIGDWISIPKFNADGVVIDISLVIVKVRNFDNSVVMVPSYSLISDSFQNWRGMLEAGGRRLKRSAIIDIQSIRFCDNALLASIKKYIDPRSIQAGNEGQLTNLGLFRHYMMSYLKQHPDVNQQMVVLVRQLAANENGVPLEVYCFSALDELPAFENFQSGLFEHIFSVMGEFGLRVYQRS